MERVDRAYKGVQVSGSLTLEIVVADSDFYYRAQLTHPNSLRAQYGISDTRNSFHGSDSTVSAKLELERVFEGFDTDWWIRRANGEIQ